MKILLFLAIISSHVFADDNFPITFDSFNKAEIKPFSLIGTDFLNIYGFIDDNKVLYSTSWARGRYFYIYDFENDAIVDSWTDFSIDKMDNDLSQYTIRPIDNNTKVEMFPIMINGTQYNLEIKYLNAHTGEELVIPLNESPLYNGNKKITFFLINNSNGASKKMGIATINETRGSVYYHETNYCFFRHPYDKNKIIIILIHDMEIQGDQEGWWKEATLFQIDLRELMK
jgi:hypothetical protein